MQILGYVGNHKYTELVLRQVFGTFFSKLLNASEGFIYASISSESLELTVART
jgi:hypothetical protein